MNSGDFPFKLRPRCTPGAQVDENASGRWRLSIPAGSNSTYRLAQLDNYSGLSRGDFPHQVPFSLRIRVRASAEQIPGTWGFGFWNDPFGVVLPGGAGGIRLPAMPNAAWFFHASAPNHLSLRDDLPGKGWLAAVYRSPGNRLVRLIPWIPFLPFVFLPAVARIVRKKVGAILPYEAVDMIVDPGIWHEYSLVVRQDNTRFNVDSCQVLETQVIPNGRLGLVIWIDNQYMAYPQDGQLRWGTLANPEPAWIEVEEVWMGEDARAT